MAKGPDTLEIRQLRELVKIGNKRKGLPAKARAHLNQARQLLLEHDHGEGAVESRKCQATGARRTMYRPGVMDDTSAGWFLVCEHGECLTTETRKRGSLAISEHDWCETCALVFEKAERGAWKADRSV